MSRRKLPSWLSKIGWLVLIPSVLLNVFLFFKYQVSDEGIKVIEVLDGDTLLLDGKVRLRLRHFDAPEQENCGGPEAKEILIDLVKDRKIIIREKILDQRGRAMALVYLRGRLINLAMIESGWGRYHHDKSSRAEVLKAAGLAAKENQLGVYSLKCYQKESPDPKCNIKGNIDVTNSQIKRYFVPGCVHYDTAIVEMDRGEQWFCSEKEAKAAGYTKSERCP